MADTIKISELPAAPAAFDADQFEVNQGGASKSLTLAQIRAGVLGVAAPASRTITDTAYTLTAADHGMTLRFVSPTPVLVAFPADLFVDFQCILFRAGDGDVSCVEDGTATIECGFDAEGSIHRTIDGRGFGVHVWCDDNPDGLTAHYWLQGVTRS